MVAVIMVANVAAYKALIPNFDKSPCRLGAIPPIPPWEDSLHQPCQHDQQCVAFLRCRNRSCVIPEAISGQPSTHTPEVLFFANRKHKGKPVAKVWADVASTTHERMRGLMYRQNMQEQWGMLFIYPQDRKLSFWMKNTYLPLDMVFIRRSGEVVGIIKGATPHTLIPRAVEQSSSYVLELKAGMANRLGIRPGLWMTLQHATEPQRLPIP